VSELFLIVGLGNPGSKYAETRHNAGFWFLDELSANAGVSLRPQAKLHAELARCELHERACILAKPATFMNHSGQAVRAVMDYFQVQPQNLLVAYDELDLPIGTVRLKHGGGHGGHNGMRDIFRHLQDPGFIRLRLGIGHPGIKDQVTSYVLNRPPAQEELQIRRSIGAAIGVLPDVLSGHLPKAMKALHTSPASGEPPSTPNQD
jgi:PTH1 family peptidyl-tRNA hydrolase